MQKLTIINENQQSKLKIDNEDLLINEYFHLTVIDVTRAHRDYLEEFLLNTKTSLPNNVRINSNYRAMKKMTRNF